MSTVPKPQGQRRRQPQQSTGKQRTLEQTLLARFMLLAGFITQIVSIETGLQPKKVRGIRKDLMDNGYTVAPTRRSLRSSKTIVVGQAGKLHASLFMSIYAKLGGIASNEGKSPTILESINIDSLLRAFSLYHIILHELPSSNLISWQNALTISDAWSLAAELRSEEATIFNCRTCGNDYYEAVIQDTLIDCPYCKELAQSTLRLFDEVSEEEVA